MKKRFNELPKWARFIAFPLDGDNDGHGGYFGKHYIFTKQSHGFAVKEKNGEVCQLPNIEVLEVG